ncbi:MAG: hypothetical protein LBE50_04820 [Gallionellaceae bacterium]|jgi:hypothetical protein|nr:hypothetical protein [Gallionellaceae bacterium]
MPDKPRQAVILIHGIGEQRPMETLRGFVNAILPPRGMDTSYYSKPDLLANNFDLRRLASAGGRNARTDFYEFYWAHLMPTAAWDRLVSWFWSLMRHTWSNVPSEMRGLWIWSWVATLFIFGAGAVQAIRFLAGYPIAADWAGNLPWIFIALGALISTILRAYVGDAAIYLSPSPRNIEARQKIREAGMALLERIATTQDYDRIIIVGHSLGSVIGYDILTFSWQRHSIAVRERLCDQWRKGEFPGNKIETTIKQAETLAKNISDEQEHKPQQISPRAAEWQASAREIHAEQKARGDGWLVTDFITLGSPLAHGSMLLAKGLDDFKCRMQERELPRCPPAGEQNGKFSFDHRDVDNQDRPQHATVLHDAAVFAATTWTNLYFPSRHLLIGDFIGGPVSPLFGPGVLDVPVKTHTWGGWLAHTHYWRYHPNDTDKATAPIARLKEALDLNRRKYPPTQKP